MSNMVTDVKIRKAELKDEEAIEILMSVYSLNIEGLMVEDFLVADIGGKIIGAACLQAGRITEVHSIAVHPDHCGKGIGKMLITALVSDVEDGTFLFARTTSPLFFEKAGFVLLDDSEKKQLWDDCAGCDNLNTCKQSVLRLTINNNNTNNG